MGGGEGKAPSPVTGSLRRFQEENESANCTVLSSYGAVCNFVRRMMLYQPPLPLTWMHAPLNYNFSILCPGKALKNVIDYVKDNISLSYEIDIKSHQ